MTIFPVMKSITDSLKNTDRSNNAKEMVERKYSIIWGYFVLWYDFHHPHKGAWKHVMRKEGEKVVKCFCIRSQSEDKFADGAF